MIDRTFNQDLIKAIVTRPDIWATVAEDGHDPDLWAPSMNGCWLAVHDGEVCKGLFELRPLNKVTLDIHPYILPEYRGTFSFEAGRSMINWILVNTSYKKLSGTIPVIYRNVKLYCKRLGFKDEGLSRQSYLKNGVICDEWIIGMTLDEMKGAV